MKIINQTEGSTEPQINKEASPRENSRLDDVATLSHDGVINYKAEIQKFLKYRDEEHGGLQSVKEYIDDPEVSDGSKRPMREITDAVRTIRNILRESWNPWTPQEIIQKTKLSETLVLEIAALSEAEMRPLLDNERDAAKILWRLSGNTGLPQPASNEMQRYRLLLEGLSYDMKIHRLTPEELEIVGPLVDQGHDYSTLSMNEELGLGWDPENPNVDMVGGFHDLEMSELTLFDSDGWIALGDFSGMSCIRTDDHDEDDDLVPERDGLTLVQTDRLEGGLAMYAVDSCDVPCAKDFSAKVGDVRIGNTKLTILHYVLFRGQSPEYDDDGMDEIEGADWMYSETVIV